MAQEAGRVGVCAAAPAAIVTSAALDVIPALTTARATVTAVRAAPTAIRTTARAMRFGQIDDAISAAQAQRPFLAASGAAAMGAESYAQSQFLQMPGPIALTDLLPGATAKGIYDATLGEGGLCN